MKKNQKNISNQVNKLLEIMEYDIPLSANEIMSRLGIKLGKENEESTTFIESKK